MIGLRGRWGINSLQGKKTMRPGRPARPVSGAQRRASLDAHERRRMLALAPACAVIYLGFSGSGARAQTVRSVPAPVNVQELVKHAVYNQLQDMRHPAHLYEYKHQEISPDSSQTTVEIQTAQGMAERLILVNGKPPSEKQCQRNLTQLARIASSPRMARQRLKNQQGDIERREELFEALPNAVLFQYDGVEKNTGWVRLKYEPNPAFRPRLRAGGVLQGLEGTMWVDPSSQRIARIDGQLVRTVSFGWGILAKLYPGGRFIMQQQKLPDGDWKQTELEVSFQGVILIFKKLNVDMKEIYSSFEKVPEGLTLSQAVDRLKSIPVDCQKP
ncbi:MAG: hypothetical protein KGM47_12200 [Acidobacteriota bacterium]|nr:hypothetical protein [Acidobacteriota bacterium]